MWTNHCLQTGDSNFPPGLYTEETDIIVQKGTNPYVDAYSAFMDNTKKLKTPLDSVLKDELDVSTIYVLGIATDYCVYFSVIDALSFGYEVFVVMDATRGIAEDTVAAATADMLAKGATLISTADVMSLECPAGETSFTPSVAPVARGGMGKTTAKGTKIKKKVKGGEKMDKTRRLSRGRTLLLD
jgi:nicotinamidase-related amidase